MFLREDTVTTEYKRISKLGFEHVYTRSSRLCIFRCDNCNAIFERKREKMSPKRLSNNYFHCCSECDSKRFAQHKGVNRKTIWDRPASILDAISKL